MGRRMKQSKRGWRLWAPGNRLVPGVSERQVEVLRRALDGGSLPYEALTTSTSKPILACEGHRWLSRHGRPGEPFWRITHSGRAALAHYDAYVAAEGKK
jgi:hypothetical protein